jgi:hypothetical protein
MEPEAEPGIEDTLLGNGAAPAEIIEMPELDEEELEQSEIPPESVENSWAVESLGITATIVRARNWLMALGLGLQRMGIVEDIQQMACERLPNGAIIVNDIGNRKRFVVKPAALLHVDVTI